MTTTYTASAHIDDVFGFEDAFALSEQLLAARFSGLTLLPLFTPKVAAPADPEKSVRSAKAGVSKEVHRLK